MNRKLIKVCIALGLCFCTKASYAVVFATVEQTMQNIYVKEAGISKKNYFLTAEQYGKLIDTVHLNKKTSRTNLYFEAVENGKVSSRVFIDTHQVRSMNETLLIKVNLKNEIEHIEILAFNEPKSYIAQEEWLKQFHNKPLMLDQSTMKQSIKPYLGATLTATAIDKAVRKVLMLNQWMNQGKL